MLVWLILSLGFFYLLKKLTKRITTVTNFLNIVALSLVILTLTQIVYYEIVTRDAWQPQQGFIETDLNAIPVNETPDIYYIILDTYASADTLREFYNFDNDEFIDYLKNRDFYIAEKSFSNYAVTTLSLASSLNMNYLDKLSSRLSENPDLDYEIPKQMIENNSVIQFLKSRGYTFVFLGSGQGVTQANQFADREIKCGFVDETMGRIIQSTLLWPAADQLDMMTKDARSQRLCVFTKIAEMSDVPGPKVVFAHILAPHAPFLFDAAGNPVRFYRAGPEQTKAHYINQLIFTNSKVEEMVEEILSESEVDPIIILQGDTGPPYGFNPATALNAPSDEIYQQNMRILNAYHLPNSGIDSLYKSITPVNTFRLIFSTYFDATLPLLDDQSYFSTGDNPYHFTNVTDSVD